MTNVHIELPPPHDAFTGRTGHPVYTADQVRDIVRAALTAPVATEQAQAVAANFIGYLCRAWGETEHPSVELVRDLDSVRRFMVREWLGEEDATDYDGTPTLPAIMEEIEGRDWRGDGEWHIEFEIGGVSVEQVFGTALAASPEAAPAAPLLLQDENSGREGRRYNEWHASRPDARLNAREAAAEKTDADAYCELAEAMGYPGGDACMLSPEEWAADLLRDAKLHRTAAAPAAPGAVTDAMIDAYLKANDAYWKRTDELPRSGVKWRNGTPREATRESLFAALAQPAPVQVVTEEEGEPVAWFAFGDSNGPVPLELYGWDKKACLHAVLTNARSTGWKGTVNGYLFEKGWTVRPVYLRARPAPVQQDAPAPSMVGDAIPYAVHAALRDAGLMLFRTERGLRVDKALTGIAAQSIVEVCPDCDIADCRHIRARRAAISGQKPAEGETPK